jgi:hypothetical protein
MAEVKEEDLASMVISRIFSAAFSAAGVEEVEVEAEVEVEEVLTLILEEEALVAQVGLEVSETNKMNSPKRKRHISIIRMYTR